MREEAVEEAIRKRKRSGAKRIISCCGFLEDDFRSGLAFFYLEKIVRRIGSIV